MEKILVLLEDPDKIHQLIDDCQKVKGEKKYVSLTPSASYAFEKFKIPFTPAREYGGEAERFQQGMKNFARIESLSRFLDKNLAYLHNSPTLTPAHYSIYTLKIFLDGLWKSIDVLKRIIEHERPDRIFLYALPKMTFRNTVFAYINEESLYAEVLQMPGWSVRNTIIQEHASGNPVLEKRLPYNQTLVSRIKRYFKHQSFLFNLGLINKRRGFRKFTKAVYYSIITLNRKPVLIYNYGYNWDDSLFEFFQLGIFPVYRVRDEMIDELLTKQTDYITEVRECLRSNDRIQEYTQIHGIDTSSFFTDHISRIIARAVKESAVAYSLTRSVISRNKIRCLLHSARERPAGHAIIQAAHDEDIPVVSWQHGGAGYCYHPMMIFIEYINTDYHFVFGEQVASSYQSTSEQFGLEKIPTFIPVGSSSLDEFHRNGRITKTKQTNKPIVYISTIYLLNVYAISLPCDPMDWDEHLWHLQKRIIDLARETPDRQFIIKLAHGQKDRDPVLSYVRDQGIENIRVITSEMTVRELTDIADIVIFDSISTGILQVLTSDSPVFVYTGLHKLDDIVHQKIKECTYAYDNLEEFITNIRLYINKQTDIISVNGRNREFLSAYGTGIHCNSAVIACKKLREIVR